MDEIEAFLDGPRARSLGISLLEEVDERVRPAMFDLEHPRGLAYGYSWRAGTAPLVRPGRYVEPPSEPTAPVEVRRGRFVELIAQVDLAAIASRTDPLSLFGALSATTDLSTPWQPPPFVDRLTAFRPVRAALRPVAAAVLQAPASAWWSSGVAAHDQWQVETDLKADGTPRTVHGWPADLDDWRTSVREQEIEATSSNAGPVESAWSGTWWSSPPRRSSTRRLGRLGAVRLALEEDSDGPERALLRRTRLADGARVYEVAGPDDWCALVDRYPLPVRFSRRGDWFRSTDLDADWCIPDFAAVAEDWDAVHLTVLGYLTTVGRALPAGGGHTVLAGWNPDETYWLTDPFALEGAAELWTRDVDADDMTAWTRSP